MNILIAGNFRDFEEIREKFGESHSYALFGELDDSVNLEDFEVIFDFNLEDDPDRMDMYNDLPNVVLFVNAVKTSLAELFYTYGKPIIPTYGFNGLPTFVSGDILELSALEGDDEMIKAIFEVLGSEYLIVGDRVGMVTPRIIFMIINEAYYTVQEGTATKEDIDLGMKLGTNYPYGPFEWAKRIGIEHVFEVIEALYDDTHDERYKICPLLKKEYLMLNS